MKDESYLVIPSILLIVFLCVLINMFGFHGGINKMQQEAVAAGHAEWVADANGNAVFKWKEAKP
jgi:hypothetical protein